MGVGGEDEGKDKGSDGTGRGRAARHGTGRDGSVALDADLLSIPSQFRVAITLNRDRPVWAGPVGAGSLDRATASVLALLRCEGPLCRAWRRAWRGAGCAQQ